MSRRAIVIVLDSVGIGEAPDAGMYHDQGASTLQHVSRAAGPLQLPSLQSLGLGCIPDKMHDLRPIEGVDPVQAPLGAFGAMQEVAYGKDTVTGHWEIAGIKQRHPFHCFPAGPPAFPDALTTLLTQNTGRGILGNCAASGTEIIARLGQEHCRTGAWIVYTSSDSVIQIAAHEEVVPLEELYAACRTVREHADRYPVGRVIARPFTGTPGRFTRTENRRDFSAAPPEPTILDSLQSHGIPVTTVGKLDDIFSHRGMDDRCHVATTSAAQEATERLVGEDRRGFIFVNFIDFDMCYGHRRDAAGYADALQQTDRWLTGFLKDLPEEDLLIITADHGNDPTFRGTDHTREIVPLLVRLRGMAGQYLGLRNGFYDVAQSLAAYFGIPPIANGLSFIEARDVAA